MLCARLIRGINSMANDVSPARARACISFGLESAPREATKMVPFLIAGISPAWGAWILKTMPAPFNAARASLAMVAPASRKAASVKDASRPASCWTTT